MVPQDGFNASFTCGAPAPTPPDEHACYGAGLVLEDSAEIEYYNGHGHGEDCRWTAVCSAGSPQIEFTEFNTEPRYDTAFALSFHCLRG